MDGEQRSLAPGEKADPGSGHGYAFTRDVFQWDVSTWSRAWPLWRRWVREHRPARGLAVGERGGGLSLWLATEGCDVLCTDAAPFPSETSNLHERHGVGDRIRYGRQDVTSLNLPDEAFDVVVFKSVIGALGTRERQETAIQEIHRVLRPGGALLFAENLTGSPLHVTLRGRYVGWSHGWRYLQVPEDRTLFAPFARSEFDTAGFLANLGRSEAQRAALARLDVLLRPVTPVAWQAVLFGVCVKA